MAWYDANWRKRFAVTIDNTKVGGDLVGFPILITEDDIPADFWANVESDGSDIVLTQSDGTTKLKRELVSIDTSGETIQLWVKTDLSGSVDTVIYLYYQYASATETNDTETWDDNFLGVWHMEDDPVGGTVADSTSNGNTGTIQRYPSQQVGKVGNCLHHTTDGIVTTLTDQCNDFTVEVWFDDLSSTSTHERLADKNYVDGFYLSRGSNVANMWGGGVQETSSPWGRFINLTDTEWHQIIARREGTTHSIIGDGGAVSASGTVPGDALSNLPFAIGCWYNGQTSQAAQDTLIDEVRFSDIARSDDWIAASYETINSPSTFYSCGAVEDAPVSMIAVEYDMAIEDEYVMEPMADYDMVVEDEYTMELRK